MRFPLGIFLDSGLVVAFLLGLLKGVSNLADQDPKTSARQPRQDLGEDSSKHGLLLDRRLLLEQPAEPIAEDVQRELDDLVTEQEG